MQPEAFPTEQIVAYVTGEADPATAERIRRAAEASTALRARIEGARSVVHALETDDAPPLTPQLARRLADLFRRPSWLERIDAAVREVATRVVDSWNQPALAGFRGTGASRQILCTGAGDVTVDLLARPGDPWIVRGQATTPAGPVDAVVGLRGSSTGELVGPEPTDETGAFVLHAPPGAYELVLEIGDRALVIEDVVLDA